MVRIAFALLLAAPVFAADEPPHTGVAGTRSMPEMSDLALAAVAAGGVVVRPQPPARSLPPPEVTAKWIDSPALLPQRTGMADILDTLEQTIRERRTGDPATSYVAKLSARGRAKIAQKLGEEATEAVIAAIQDDKAELTKEAADLVFHLLMLLADADLSLNDVRAELARREGVSGIDEKAARPS